MTTVNTRRYDLDWLRVLAFFLLIFYHIGMFFNSEGWHAKSAHMNSSVDPFMWLSSPWRLSLLFLISGIALRFAADKAALIGPMRVFAGKRFLRLFVPLVFGMLVIVAPQSYFELLGKGEISPGYLDFYGQYLSGNQSYSIIVPTWNHLWYVFYMLVYTMLLLPLMPQLRKLAAVMDNPWFERLMGGGRLFILPAAIFILYRFTSGEWFPYETHIFWGDWDAHIRYSSYFVLGILFAKNQAFWRVLVATWRIGVITAVLLAISLSLLWANWDNWFDGIDPIEATVHAMRPLYAWVMIMALLGTAQAYLNKPSAQLTYLTQAVFPYYILHQSLIVVFGVMFDKLGLSVWPEFLLVLLATIVGCLVANEFIIRRIAILRPLFGLPMRPKLAEDQGFVAQSLGIR